jgi:hypothetical protein
MTGGRTVAPNMVMAGHTAIRSTLTLNASTGTAADTFITAS